MILMEATGEELIIIVIISHGGGEIIVLFTDFIQFLHENDNG